MIQSASIIFVIFFSFRLSWLDLGGSEMR